MRINILVFTALVGTTTVSASGDIILRAIKDISGASVALNTTLNQLSGNLLGDVLKLGQLTIHTAALYDKTRTAARLASKSANLTGSESFDLALPILDLVTTVNTTVESMIRAKAKLQADQVGGVVGLTLQMQKEQSARFSSAMIRITPESEREMALDVAVQIAESFNKGIAAFN